MAGIYVHIPFCHSKCHYCNFYSVASKKHQKEMQEAILLELQQRHHELKNNTLNTIYFGGGTPSLFPAAFYHQFLEKLYQFFALADDAEITLEANPEDIDKNYLKSLPAQINRISLGVQSLNDNELKTLGRKHSAASAHQAIDCLNRSEIDNISIDLIYGIPGTDENALKQNLEIMKRYSIQHLSAYALTVEEGTALDYLVKKKRFYPSRDEQYERDYHTLRFMAGEQGFEHYEISNFAKAGYRAMHNSAYWSGEAYLGLGPSAHSFDGKTRSWNISRISDYIQQMRQGTLARTIEKLSRQDQFNESLMTGLRTKDGVSLKKLRKNATKPLIHKMLETAKPFIDSGRLVLEQDILRIPPQYWFLSDAISADLFWG